MKIYVDQFAKKVMDESELQEEVFKRLENYGILEKLYQYTDEEIFDMLKPEAFMKLYCKTKKDYVNTFCQVLDVTEEEYETPGFFEGRFIG